MALESGTSEHRLGVSSKVKVKVTLEQTTKVQRGSRGIIIINNNNNNFIKCKWVDTRWQWSFNMLHMYGLFSLI